VILSFRAATDLYNLDVVLDAFCAVHRRIPDATLVLVHGETPLAERLRPRVDALERLGAVRRHGRVTHAAMAAHMRAATVGVSVPSSDGSPNSVWEAMATGLPLVLSKLPQVEERVGGSGGAVFVEPRVEAVAAALVELLEDRGRRLRMADAARGWAESHLDERAQVARLRAVYAAAWSSP
jgi:glycosyltransferase involved in cell wall biosynthesis